MTLAVFLLALGATARIVRLITDDRVLGKARGWVIRKAGDPDHWAPYLVHCPWCVSPYIGGAIFTLGWFYGNTPWFIIPTAVATASWLIGIAAGWLDNPGGE